MFPGLTLAYWMTLHGLVTVLAVGFYAITAHVMQQRRHPTAAIAWVLFILLVPYVALPTFLAFGSRKQTLRRPDAARPLIAAPPGADWSLRVVLSLGQPAPAAYDDLRLHADGREALMALRQTISGATRSIDLSTFIIGGELGKRIGEHLAEKARSGVEVRLLLDGLGHLMGGRIDLAPLKAAGVRMVLFVPPLHRPWKRQGRLNLRNHRKLLIADAGDESARRLWVGGRNLAPEYFEGEPDAPPWHDLSFDLRGPLVAQAAALFEHDWNFARGVAPDLQPPRPVPAPPAAARSGAQLVASGPDQVDDTVYSLLVSGAYRAEQRIALITPYFVPDSALLLALCLAARRGVAVDLLIPDRSNHRMSDIARQRALRTLAAAGGRIWLAPQMLHAKLAIIDDELALAGSANLDSRSLFLNYELMVAFRSPDAVHAFGDWFQRERSTARRFSPERPSFARDVAEGLVLWIGFQL